MAIMRVSPIRLRVRRLGVALLLVLAVIVLVLPILVGVSRRALIADQEMLNAARWTEANSIRVGLEAGPLQTWLARESERVVLGPEATAPHVDVLQAEWEHGGRPYRVQLSAWDQRGMVSSASLAGGSPLRTALPAEVLDRLEAVAPDAGEPQLSGLDQLAFSVDAAVSAGPGQRAFPGHAEPDQGIGAWITLHPAGRSDTLNVNTTPLSLVAAAMRLAGRGGFEAIVNARSLKRPAPLPRPLEGRDRTAAIASVPRFAGASDCWGVRIDVRVGEVRRSWWCVYSRGQSGWECEQRLVIAE